MADKSRTVLRRKERKDKEAEEVSKDVKEVKTEGDRAGDTAAGAAAVANGHNGDPQVEPMELPPFEIIAGYVHRLQPLTHRKGLGTLCELFYSQEQGGLTPPPKRMQSSETQSSTNNCVCVT